MKEAIEGTGAGLLAPPGDARSLAATLARLLDDRAALERASQRAHTVAPSSTRRSRTVTPWSRSSSGPWPTTGTARSDGRRHHRDLPLQRQVSDVPHVAVPQQAGGGVQARSAAQAARRHGARQHHRRRADAARGSRPRSSISLRPKSRRLELSTNGYFTDRLEKLCRRYPELTVRISLEGLRRDERSRSAASRTASITPSRRSTGCARSG